MNEERLFGVYIDHKGEWILQDGVLATNPLTAIRHVLLDVHLLLEVTRNQNPMIKVSTDDHSDTYYRANFRVRGT